MGLKAKRPQLGLKPTVESFLALQLAHGDLVPRSVLADFVCFPLHYSLTDGARLSQELSNWHSAYNIWISNGILDQIRARGYGKNS